MTHRLHIAIADQLERHLKDRRVVVWYDARKEFGDFITELDAKPLQQGALKAKVGRTDVVLVASDPAGKGSLVAAKLHAEPFVATDYPEPVVIYLPGREPDRQNSPLMELELAGLRWEPQLRGIARHLLRDIMTDAAIDKVLAPDLVTYAEVAGMLRVESGGGAAISPLRSVFPRKDLTSERLLATWIAIEKHDAKIDANQAVSELYELLSGRIGLTIDSTQPLSKSRYQARRYVLVNEFRDDYQGDPPAVLGSVPRPKLKEHRERLSAIAALLRTFGPGLSDDNLGQHYADIADAVQAEFNLDKAPLDPSKLGLVDTFRCEEVLLLAYAAERITSGHADQALEIISQRGVSFWTTRDTARGAQWELCRRIAVLHKLAAQVDQSIGKEGSSPAAWLEAYAREDGWFAVDQAQRSLETWLAGLSDDPNESVVKALHAARLVYDTLIERMAQGFSQRLRDAKWVINGTLHQTRIFPDIVESVTEATAYVLVDAMRFEMADDLRKLLIDARDLTLRPAVAALPSITPVGMAALLPGASTAFGITAVKGGLAARVDGHDLAILRDRQKYLKAVRPKSADIALDDVLTKSPSHVKQKIKDATLVVVRTTDIDALGEAGGLLARQVMDQVVANVARAIRKLAKLGIKRFVVTADHGHLFASERDDGAKIPAPGGTTVDLHRRCWIGHGGQVSGAAIRVASAELGYVGDLDLMFPKGSAVFAAGGDLAYHHGGVSLQEMVIPVLSGRMPTTPQAGEKGGNSGPTFHFVPATITNRIFRIQIALEKSLFENGSRTVRLVVVDAMMIEVGRAGMASNTKKFDAATGVMELNIGAVADVALMLTNDKVPAIRVLVVDAHTDAELGSTAEIPVKLGL